MISARLPLVGPPSGRCRSGPGRDAECHPVEPRAQRVAPANRGRLAGQDQERRLEGVLSLVRIAKDLAADSEDHRAMTFHQGGEGDLGRLILSGCETIEELRVAQANNRPGVEERLEMPQASTGSSVLHGIGSSCP